MFDESEILFLDTAVKLQFVTASQRARLIAFAEEDDIGAVTEVVVDANLMTDDEVSDTMQAIQAGVAMSGSMPASVKRGDLAGAATSASISALIGEDDDVASADTDKIAKSGSSYDALEYASRTPTQLVFEDDEDQRGGPAFPLPSGANAFPRESDQPAGDGYHDYEEEDQGEQTMAQQLAVSRGEMASLLDAIDVD